MIIETFIVCLFLWPLISALADESRERTHQLEIENDKLDYEEMNSGHE